jgi:hypothetical protein
MKNSRLLSKIDSLDTRIELSNYQNSIPKSKLSSGSLINKYPIYLDDGKTTIFIADQSQESEVRRKYEMRKSSIIHLKNNTLHRK